MTTQSIFNKIFYSRKATPMTHHSVSTKVFSVILSLLMAAQVFPLAAMADSITVDTEYSSLEAFPDYEPEVVYDDGITIRPELPSDFTYLSKSDYEFVDAMELEDTEETEDTEDSEESEDADSETDSSTEYDDEVDFNAQPLIRNKKSLTSDSEESIHTLGGALEYSNTDYVLKGINGLDLVIGRRYKSTSSYDYKVKNDEQTKICTRYRTGS